MFVALADKFSPSDLKDTKTGVSVAKFLNRLLGMQLERQGILFDFFSTVFDAMMRDERSKKNVDDGISRIQGRRVRLKAAPRRLAIPNGVSGRYMCVGVCVCVCVCVCVSAFPPPTHSPYHTETTHAR